MKIDLSNKRNLIILASLAGVAFAAALFFVVFSGGPKTSEEARRAAEAREARGPLPAGAEVEGMPATPEPGGPGAEGGAEMAPEGPEMAAAGPGDPGMAPEGPSAGMPGGPDEGSAPEAKPAAPKPFEAEGDGGTIPKGPPVEPYRPDPFVTAAKVEAPRPAPVLPPLVVVRQPPQAMVIPATVNVIPTSIIARGSAAIRDEVQRRLSGVLWNGKVFAILESTDQAQRAIVQPGEQVGKDLWVKSISRSQMVLVREDGARGREEIVVDLKEAQRQPAMGLGPGGMPGMPPGPGGFPGGIPAP
ncbi:MAG TPA: hypothetical protein GX715_19390 [Armatimonadetes bacterium]|nr:hypothetical protein [Armatimonadota bacterium]